MHRLAARHEIALVYLRASDEPPLDAQLTPELAHAEEIEYATRRSATDRIHGAARDNRAGGSLGHRGRVMTYAANPMAYFAVHRTRRQEGSMGPRPRARGAHTGATCCALGGMAVTSPVRDRACSAQFSASHGERCRSIPSGIDPSAVPLAASAGAHRQPRSAP